MFSTTKVDYFLYIIEWLLHGAIDPGHVGWWRICVFRIQLIMCGMIDIATYRKTKLLPASPTEGPERNRGVCTYTISGSWYNELNLFQLKMIKQGKERRIFMH